MITAGGMLIYSGAGVEVNGAIEVTRNICIVASIAGDSTATIITRPAPSTSPLANPRGIEFTQEYIKIVNRCMLIDPGAGVKVNISSE